MTDSQPARHVFVTGYPGFIARRLVEYWLEADPTLQVDALHLPDEAERARRMVDRLSPDSQRRVRLVPGNVADLHLGLPGTEWRRLADSVTHLAHLAGVHRAGADRRLLRSVNVEGTRNVLELAAESTRLSRVWHMSTTAVAGDRLGVVAEDELDEGQHFTSEYARSKFEAEKLVRRSQPHLPICVFRAGIVVGDSRTGEMDSLDGPYDLSLLLFAHPEAPRVRMPADASAPLHVVPVDYVVQAMLHIGLHPRAVGGTFHLVDPNPMSARRVYELLAARAGRPPPRQSTSEAIRSLLHRATGRSSAIGTEGLVLYNSAEALGLLGASGIACPPLASYIDRLAGSAERLHEAARVERHAAERQTDDAKTEATTPPAEDALQ